MLLQTISLEKGIPLSLWRRLLRDLGGKCYCGISQGKVIPESVWKTLLWCLSGKGYCYIFMEKIIAVSAWEWLLRYLFAKGYCFFLYGLFFLGYNLHDRGMAKEFNHNHGHPRKIQRSL